MFSRLKNRKSVPQRALTVFAFVVFSVTLAVLYAGGFTTTIQAGMVFPDWPFSNGSLNPPGWTTDEAMLAEHGHRLLAGVMALLTVALAGLMYLREERSWLRRLSYFAVGLVLFQALLGGLRVLLVSIDLAKVHGITAQLYLCTLAAIAVGSARWWRAVPTALTGAQAWAWNRERWLGVALCGLLVAQLVIGAVMRHRGAGLAISTFPYSTPGGDWLPLSWNWAVTLHFSHRAMALVISVVLVVWAVRVLLSRRATSAMKGLALLAVGLLCVQVALGAGIIWSVRKPIETTLHVLNGALLLSTVWSTTFAYFRPLLEGVGDTPVTAAPVARERDRLAAPLAAHSS